MGPAPCRLADRNALREHRCLAVIGVDEIQTGLLVGSGSWRAPHERDLRPVRRRDATPLAEERFRRTPTLAR
jgi:hypothetical protein